MHHRPDHTPNSRELPAQPLITVAASALVAWTVELHPGQTATGSKRRLNRVTRIVKTLGGTVSDSYVTQQGSLVLMHVQLAPGTEDLLRMLPEVFLVTPSGGQP